MNSLTKLILFNTCVFIFLHLIGIPITMWFLLYPFVAYAIGWLIACFLVIFF
jgi:hypothetical protein